MGLDHTGCYAEVSMFIRSCLGCNLGEFKCYRRVHVVDQVCCYTFSRRWNFFSASAPPAPPAHPLATTCGQSTGSVKGTATVADLPLHPASHLLTRLSG